MALLNLSVLALVLLGALASLLQVLSLKSSVGLCLHPLWVSVHDVVWEQGMEGC